MDTDHWASYYRSGALVSCPTNPEPYYTLEVRDAWARFFSGLSDGDRVLDIGTGNGPVALIAKQTANERNRNIQIDGVDLAEIDPHQNVPDGENLLGGIRFHGHVNIEALPFYDQHFDAISGQYIVEYTDKRKTLAECARVLVPGGRCQFVLHHLDSVIVRNALESLRQADLIRETSAIRRFKEYCEHPQSETSRAALFEAGEKLQVEAKASSNPILLRFLIDAISGMLAKRSQMTEGERLIVTTALERDLKNWIQRLKDLASAALSKREMTALCDEANDAGFSGIDLDTQMQDGDKLVGWRLSMSRAI